MNPERQIPVIWVGVEDAPVVMSNQVLSQFEAEQFFLTFGHITPPVIFGTPEEQRQQAERIGYVPVKTIARLSLTPQRMRELIGVLQQNLANWQQQHGGEV